MVSKSDLEYLEKENNPEKYNPERFGKLKTIDTHPTEDYSKFKIPTPKKVKDFYGDVIWVPSPDPERASVSIVYVMTADGRSAVKAPWLLKGGVHDWYHFREVSRYFADAVGAAKNMRRGENDERPLLLSFYDPELIAYRKDELNKERHPYGVIVTGSGEIDGGLDHVVFQNEGESIIFTSDEGLSKLEKEALQYEGIHIESIGPSARALDMHKMLRVLKSKYGVERFVVLGGPNFSTSLIQENLVDNYFLNESMVLIGDKTVRSYFDGEGFPLDQLTELEPVSIKRAEVFPEGEGRHTLFKHYTPWTSKDF